MLTIWKFAEVFCNASKLAEEVSVTVTKLRNNSSMKHRGNAPADTPEECYSRSMFLHFLNHVTVNFKSHEILIVSIEKNNTGKMYKFKYRRYNTTSG